MHETPQETAGPAVPLESGVMPGPEPSSRHYDFSDVSPQVVVRLMGLIDEAEGLFGDPDKALAALKIMIDDRQAQRESRKASDDPIPTEVLRRETRPFVGFDREQ